MQGSAHVVAPFSVAREVFSSSYVLCGVIGLIGFEERHGLHHCAGAVGDVLMIDGYDAPFLHVGHYPLCNDFGAAIEFGGVVAVGIDAGPDKGDEVEEAGGKF